ncbi:glutathione synthetase [Klebsiella michiganensis]|uniref:Glutathione synthetase n=1 Tax=Klebsiella michiganensis TaxID=1134687 RepID=A0A7H4M658_9ENTR|nr:glutathione synthetase [Klebsiella michiganensis]
MITETLTELGSRYCMAQNYLPAIKDGDKRVLVVDGEPVPYCLAVSRRAAKPAVTLRPVVVAKRAR